MQAISVEVEGSGRPLILIPGFACAPNVWFKVREILARDFELHLVTVAGFGGPPRVPPPVLPRIREELIRLCLELDDVILLGHSFGAFLAMWTAASHPERVSALIAVDGLPFFPTLFDLEATPESMRERAVKESQELRAEPKASAAAGATYFDQHILDPADAAYMNETTPTMDRDALADIRYEILTTDIRPEISNIKAPTLYIAAGRPWLDESTDVQALIDFYVERVGSIKDLGFQVAVQSRHFVMIDDPEFFIESVVRFSRLH